MKFKIWEISETEEDACDVEADYPEAAVEEWAREYDADGDYTILNGSTPVVLVKNEAGVVQAAWVCH